MIEEIITSEVAHMDKQLRDQLDSAQSNGKKAFESVQWDKPLLQNGVKFVADKSMQDFVNTYLSVMSEDNGKLKFLTGQILEARAFRIRSEKKVSKKESFLLALEDFEKEIYGPNAKLIDVPNEKLTKETFRKNILAKGQPFKDDFFAGFQSNDVIQKHGIHLHRKDMIDLYFICKATKRCDPDKVSEFHKFLGSDEGIREKLKFVDEDLGSDDVDVWDILFDAVDIPRGSNNRKIMNNSDFVGANAVNFWPEMGLF